MADWSDGSVLLDAAVEFCRLGGRIAAARLGTARTSRKADRTLVTQVDTEIQEALLDAIGRRFGDDAVLAEEDLVNPQRHARLEKAEYCWVIDPLDGTRNFSRSLPIFATTVAVMRGGYPVVGVICDAMTSQVYSAVVGRGATLDGRPMHVRDEPLSRDTMIAVRGKSGQPAPQAIHRWADRYVLRNIGSASLHLAFVASGSLDASFNAQCKLWDLAAGWLLIGEAGGVVTFPNGDPIFPLRVDTYRNRDMGFLAAGRQLHACLLPETRDT